MKRVFLIDTMSHIFRAFFAPMGARQEPLRNSKGQVTQAVFVFTNMLRKLLNGRKSRLHRRRFRFARPNFSPRFLRRLQGKPRRNAGRSFVADAVYHKGLRSVQYSDFEN